MTNLEVVLNTVAAFTACICAGFATSYYTRKFITAAKAFITSELERLDERARCRAENFAQYVVFRIRESEKQVTEYTRQGLGDVRGDVKKVHEHFKEHTDQVIKQTEEMKAHAREVLDKSAAKAWSHITTTARATCAFCNRLVWQFESIDGKIICGDCKKR